MEQNVVAFPGADYDTWYGWAECELAIMGFDINEQPYDWQAAFDQGLRPEVAASEAARTFEIARPTGEIARPTGEIARPTGEIARPTGTD